MHSLLVLTVFRRRLQGKNNASISLGVLIQACRTPLVFMSTVKLSNLDSGSETDKWLPRRGERVSIDFKSLAVMSVIRNHQRLNE